MRFEGPAVTVASGVAVLFSGFTLWDTALQDSDLRVFVPPVIPAFDARIDAMPLYAKDWQSAVSGESK